MLHVIVVYSFSLLFGILFYEYFTIHSVIDGHLSSFGLNNVAVKVLEHVFWCTYACISVGYIYLRVKLLGHSVCMHSDLVEYVYTFLTF